MRCSLRGKDGKLKRVGGWVVVEGFLADNTHAVTCARKNGKLKELRGRGRRSKADNLSYP